MHEEAWMVRVAWNQAHGLTCRFLKWAHAALYVDVQHLVCVDRASTTPNYLICDSPNTDHKFKVYVLLWEGLDN